MWPVIILAFFFKGLYFLFCLILWGFLAVESLAYVQGLLKSFADLLVWYCFPATYWQGLSDSGVGISDY